MNTHTDDNGMQLRVPPHSVEAEQSVLGGLLLDNSAWDRAGDLLTDSDFYRFEHRAIYAAVGALINANKAADIVTVFEYLQRTGKGGDCGGLVYLNSLAASVPSAANLRRYAEIVRDKAVLRSVICFGSSAVDMAFKSADASETVDRVATMCAELDRRLLTGTASPVGGLVHQVLDDYERAASGEGTPGFKTGIPTLDKLLQGLVPALYYIGGRPGTGKTSFAGQIVLNLAQAGRRVLFLSLEMDRKQVARRMVANLGRVDYSRLKAGHLDDDEVSRLSEGAEKLAHLPIHIDDQPALRLSDIRRKARAIKGIDLVVLDYLQLCAGDRRSDNRNAQVEEISRGLKALSKDLTVPVIALSQLNRKVEERADKRPSLADLRDSGSIEQDADAIIFLWPVRDLPGTDQKLRGCEVAKNRDGAVGEFGLAFDARQQRWVESTSCIRPVVGQRVVMEDI